MVLSVEVEEVGCNRREMNGGSVDLMSEGAKVVTMKSDRAVRSLRIKVLKAPVFQVAKMSKNVVMSQWATECGARQRNSQITVMIRPGAVLGRDIWKYQKSK